MPADTIAEPEAHALAQFEWAWLEPEWGDRYLYGQQSLPCQLEMRRSLRDRKLTSWATANGMGKTADVIPKTVVDFVFSAPAVRVILTGATHDSILGTVIPHLREIVGQVNERFPGLLAPIPRGSRWSPFGADHPTIVEVLSPDAVAAMQGRHAEHTLTIVDEASSLELAMLVAILSYSKSPTARVALMGNPIVDSGAFFDTHHARREAWGCGILDAFRSPNFADDAPRIPSMPSPDSVALDKLTFGEESFEYQSRVLARWPTEGTMSVITPAMIEAAAKRWQGEQPVKGRKIAGIDTGITTDGDPSVGYCRDDERTLGRFEVKTDDPALLLAETRRFLDDQRPDMTYIDAQGAPYLPGQLLALGYKVEAIRFGSEAHDPATYVDQRAEMYFTMRAALRHEAFAIDPTYAGKLAAQAGIRRIGTTDGRNRLEPKERLKERIGRSPDDQDALALTFVEPLGESVYSDIIDPAAHQMRVTPNVAWREAARAWIMTPGELHGLAQQGTLARSCYYSRAEGFWAVWVHVSEDGPWTLFDAVRLDAGRQMQELARETTRRSRDASSRPHTYRCDLFTYPEEAQGRGALDAFGQYVAELGASARELGYNPPRPMLIKPEYLAGVQGMERIERLLLGTLAARPDHPYWRGREAQLMRLASAGRRSDMLKVWLRGVLDDLAETRSLTQERKTGANAEGLVGGGGGYTRCLRALAITMAGAPQETRAGIVRFED